MYVLCVVCWICSRKPGKGKQTDNRTGMKNDENSVRNYKNGKIHWGNYQNTHSFSDTVWSAMDQRKSDWSSFLVCDRRSKKALFIWGPNSKGPNHSLEKILCQRPWTYWEHKKRIKNISHATICCISVVTQSSQISLPHQKNKIKSQR